MVLLDPDNKTVIFCSSWTIFNTIFLKYCIKIWFLLITEAFECLNFVPESFGPHPRLGRLVPALGEPNHMEPYLAHNTTSRTWLYKKSHSRAQRCAFSDDHCSTGKQVPKPFREDCLSMQWSIGGWCIYSCKKEYDCFDFFGIGRHLRNIKRKSSKMLSTASLFLFALFKVFCVH